MKQGSASSHGVRTGYEQQREARCKPWSQLGRSTHIQSPRGQSHRHIAPREDEPRRKQRCKIKQAGRGAARCSSLGPPEERGECRNRRTTSSDGIAAPILPRRWLALRARRAQRLHPSRTLRPFVHQDVTRRGGPPPSTLVRAAPGRACCRDPSPEGLPAAASIPILPATPADSRPCTSSIGLDEGGAAKPIAPGYRPGWRWQGKR